jgi:DNA sulfur modification protein DndD
MMKFSIESIELFNYRQFKGEHILKFHYNPDKNVSIILGRNGAGKSNILNAITWCLYGIEVHADKKEYNTTDMPIVNATVISELNTGEKASAEVKITLQTQQGKWIIERTITGFKNPKGLLTYEFGNLKVVRKIKGETIIDEGEDTQILINNLLPVDLRSFFFIDGEQLREFFKFRSPEKVAKAVEQVSQLELIEQADEHLRELKRDLRKDVRESTPQLDTIHQKISSNDEKIADNLKSISTLSELIENWQVEMEEIREYLIKTNNGDLKNLISERTTIENDLHHLENDLVVHYREKNRYLIEVGPYIYLKKEIEQSKALIEKNIEEKTKLHNISRELIKSILLEKKCICGKEIDDEAKTILKSYSDEFVFSDLRDIFVSGKNRYDDILKNLTGFREKLEGHSVKIQEKRNQIETKNRRIKQIKESILNFNEDEITQKEVQRDELFKKISTKEQAIKILDKQNYIYTKNNLDLQEEEKKEIFKDQKNEVLRKKLEIVDNALKVFSKTSEQIKYLVRKHVEETTQENFFALIRKKDAFKEICINEKYEVTVQHVKGFNVVDHLSAGEYMILGLSFMSSLMTISGFKAPVIIDTPLGKIDDEHRDHITSKLPHFVEGTQLILLVTPTEYDDMVKTNLGKYLLPKNFYRIQENAANTESMVTQ